ncbi:hypothetical protein XOC_3409 [Xanthomonas oryzae pv. oryzicola BLS256]|uniref:Uncharacterized protein n=1 Tax=Xanthomonas oryzae pv. oryzicola (strain BLS256) TaxID=383407 RepID=G7TCY6_XANOB|nr:hypothetical protein XOC_3409 [Xanthomonas oryzae pv. oryzicola BLS256]QEO96356.1 hypothetical protein XOCgx_1363 [Xanthomonas oryzae pv. oryzicola]
MVERALCFGCHGNTSVREHMESCLPKGAGTCWWNRSGEQCLRLGHRE